ncbi:hypothetical protein JOC78_002182 [Bacillus ectoiniformans]|uniref:VWA domain-containing protein n=1 Tax=Bacillus ectoiniformans TaxID=1494429 RepID=UPI00195DBADB|nr:VWA domain-containing protein [Bacillus ectoiniformans]MBM7649229.1 hypothetical protein [Bacillus ectoiniformans]
MKEWKLTNKPWQVLAVSTLLLLTGCGSDEEKQINEQKAESSETQESENEGNGQKANDPSDVATSMEEILKEKPGEYAGNKYNKAVVHRALDEKNVQEQDSFQIYDSLLKLMAEGNNYEKHYEFFEGFDPSIQTAVSEMPGGMKLGEDGEVGINANVAILLDASGSMAQKIGGKTKMELAKEKVDEFVATLPEEANVMLRVYGHKGSNSDSDKELSCKSTEVVYDLKPYEEADFKASLGKFQPTGWTPLAHAISETKNEFNQAGNDGQNIMYVVSDGIETCDGDPVAAAKSLHDSNIKAVVNIIGFDVDSNGQSQLRSIAEAGGGQFETVDSADDFERVWKNERSRLWSEWFNWGNKNWSKVFNEQNEKSNKLFNQKTDFSNMIYDEKTRLNEAASYFQDQDQIDYDTRQEVSSLIDQRYNILDDYLDETYGGLKETVETEGDTLKEAIKAKEEEMKKKYKD